MNPSMNLMTAQISFLEGRYALIHVPLPHYPFFLQPICRLLFGEDHDEDAHKIPWPYRHHFLNVSITPVECSVVCSRYLAERVFVALADRFNDVLRKGDGTDPVQISAEDFLVIQVDGQGLDAGQRVLELTYPLALAGISILFETTYFSDYILIPHKSIRMVIQTLEERGFTFSPSAAAYVSDQSPSSPRSPSHFRQSSGNNPFDSPTSPRATTAVPPASNIKDLQRRTFARLKHGGTTLTVDPTIRLVSCAGRREAPPSLDARLRSDLFQVLLATCPGMGYCDRSTVKPADAKIPDLSSRFLSLTLTADEPISLLLESCLFSKPQLSLSSALHFSQSSPGISFSTLASTSHDEGEPGQQDGEDGEETEKKSDVLIPITLDLRELPVEATGIVCGVAGRLAQGADPNPVVPHSSASATTSRIPFHAAENPITRSYTQENMPLSPRSRPITDSNTGDSNTGDLMVPLGLPVTNVPPNTRDRERQPSGQRQVNKNNDDDNDMTQDSEADNPDHPLNLDISFLSTARAGTVIVRESDLKQAVRALELEVARGGTAEAR